MLTKIKEQVIKKKVTSLLKKYDVVLKHYMPGRVRVVLSNWKDKKVLLHQLIADLKTDPDVISINFTEETGSVTIQFNQAEIVNPNTQQRWARIFEQYNL